MHNIYNEALAQKALASQTITTGTVKGLTVDCGVFSNNFRDVAFHILAGTLTDGTYAVTVQESDTTVDGDFVAVDAARVIGSLPSYAATDDNVLTSFGVRPTKRYVRIVVTAATATSGGVFAAIALLAAGSNHPVARS